MIIKNLIPNLLLIKAVKNANEFLEVQNTLVVYNDDGTIKLYYAQLIVNLLWSIIFFVFKWR